MLRLNHRALLAAAALVPALGLSSSVFGYGFYRYGNGRADFNLRYDLVGNSFPAQANVVTYNFGKFDGFTPAQLTGLGLTAGQVDTAITNATGAWEQYLNINIDNTTAANGTGGLIRLNYTGPGSGASTTGYQHTGNNWTNINFAQQVSAGVNWTPTNFEWTLKHEIGHMLGLRDMYPDFAGASYAEDFVDHPLAGNPVTYNNGNLALDDGRKDNLMDRVNNTNNYTLAPTTNIDNDEIAGGAWIWGSGYNQIVCGDLKNQWEGGGAANAVRRTEEHHGDQPTNAGGAGWWDYRVSVKPGGTEKPHIDIDFPGYQLFAATLYDDDGNVPTITETSLGGYRHRFEINEAGWGGNIELYLQSTFTDEAYVSAFILGGGRTDKFTTIPTDTGLDFAGGDTWARVFGPIPEPTSCVLASSLALMAMQRRSRRVA